jgi:predicted ATPase
VPELFRVKGELSIQQCGDRSLSAAEGLFSEAIELARKQAALFWELRTDVSLARLRIRQRRQAEARNVLVPICRAFAAETEFSDLRTARELLNSLSARRAG